MSWAGVLLGLDLGTGSRKALLEASGAVAGLGRAGHAVDSARPGWAKADPAAWWTAAATATRQAVGDRANQVVAVGLSGQMHVVVPAADGRPVRPAILWPDARATAEAAK